MISDLCYLNRKYRIDKKCQAIVGFTIVYVVPIARPILNMYSTYRLIKSFVYV